MDERIEPPCRVCGSSRDAHGTVWNHDHRYRATRYCTMHAVPTVEATWYVDGDLMCSRHKGAAVRNAEDPWSLRTEKIEKVVRYG